MKENRGRAAAANAGVGAASGIYITFLDDDDLYCPDALTTLVEWRRLCGVAVVYGRVVLRHFRANGKPDPLRADRHFAFPFNRDVLLIENFIPLNALLFDKKILEHYGLFREDLTFCEDWEFLLRISGSISPSFVDHLVAIYRTFGDVTASGNRFDASIMEKVITGLMSERWAQVTPEVVRAYQTFMAGHIKWISDDLSNFLVHSERERDALAQEVQNLKGFLSDSEQEVQNLKGFFSDSENERNALSQEVQNFKKSFLWRLIHR